jgi:hypothetical protein
MKNSKTPKVVVAVGLVAVYATGLTILTLRDKGDTVVAQQAASVPAAQIAAAPAAPSEIVPPPTEATTTVADQPAVPAVAAAASVPAQTPAPVARVAAKTDAAPLSRSEPVVARPATEEQKVASVAAASAPEPGEVAPSTETSEGTSPASEPATHAGDDSQITADVKSKIAAVAPEGTIDVTTKDGVVELAGSVPSQDVIDRARMVASNVPDVRGVDVSALMVAN